MTYTMVILKADGTRVESHHAKAPDLGLLQAAVGGYIETLQGFTQLSGTPAKRAKAYCNEDGFAQGLPSNRAATDEYKRQLAAHGYQPDAYLIGDIVVYWKDVPIAA